MFSIVMAYMYGEGGRLHALNNPPSLPKVIFPITIYYQITRPE